ncbi:hypothetical protein [Persicirhabdus sediminis]|uniref:Uncharacterized protein n=1 Tax=Persicirhabdus sediminis TaxID=454144 RepID=A0A8J7MD21_9BACT|nr:hypothetical protein [Persicirhabdus sediminis]MBK1790926.1 hypothetical protein [Persicirhabdus sediminis]
MKLTVLTAISLIILGIVSTASWKTLGLEEPDQTMLMSIFFGGALIISLLFKKMSESIGELGTAVVSGLGIVSMFMTLWDNHDFSHPTPKLVTTMGAICCLHFFAMVKRIRSAPRGHD